MKRAWWKEGIVYQIYPRSFMDSNGDGIGDLRGIINRLDYIKSLGIDIVWLNPIYQSPNDDNGYDISNYREVMDEFGSMDDFDELLAGFHERGIRLVMDLVVNHSSDEHEWFRQSRSSRDNPYRDYYHWWPAEKGTPPKRFSLFDDRADAWAFDEQTNAYYLHYFGKKQPDLNWENPEVREAVFDMMHFWFKKGIDGFRMDVVAFLSKDETWPNFTDEEIEDAWREFGWIEYYANGPRIHEYLNEMNRRVFSQYDAMSVGETAGATLKTALDFVDEDRQEMDMFFHFDGMGVGLKDAHIRTLDPKGWKLSEFKGIYNRWSDAFAKKGWGSIYLGNHDQPRVVTRWGDDSPEFHAASAKMLHTFLLSMRSTPFIYYGDEIGMTNIRFDTIEQYNDLWTRNLHKQLVSEGKDPAPYLEDWKITARDNGRTPMQWDDTSNSGFSSGSPWIPVNPNHVTINVAAQNEDPDSILNYFRKMTALRKADEVLIYGDYEMVDPENEQVYAYLRTLENDARLILLNFSDKDAKMELPQNIKPSSILINNVSDFILDRRIVQLKPYQAVVLNCEVA